MGPRFILCGVLICLLSADVMHAFDEEPIMSLSDVEEGLDSGSPWSDEWIYPYISLLKTNKMEVQVANQSGPGYGSKNRTNRHKGSYLSHLNLYSKGLVRYLPLYLSPILIVFGIFGNIISFIVLYNFTKTQRFSSDFHLCTLAIFDTGGLICSSFPFWANTFLRADLGMRGITSPFQTMLGEYGACHFWFYVSFNFRYLSHWTIVIFSIERFLILSRPFEASTRFTIKRAAMTTAALIAVTMICNIHIFFMFDKGILPGGHTICKWRPIFYKANFIHLIFMALIPSILIIVFNSLIIRALMKHRREDPRVVGDEGKARERGVTRRMVAVSVGFVALTIPFMCVAYYRNIQTLRGVKDFPVVAADVFSFCLCLYLSNYACNFVLYCVTGKRFRDAVVDLFRCGRLAKKKSMDHTDSSKRTSSTMLSPDRGSLIDQKGSLKGSLNSVQKGADADDKKNKDVESVPLTSLGPEKEYHSSV